MQAVLVLNDSPMREVDDAFTRTWEKVSDAPYVFGCLFL
jgi:hypothetical protein